MIVQSRMASLALAPAIVLAGCVTVEAPPGDPPIERRAVGSEQPCDASGTDSLIGEAATAKLGATIERKTGARIFQWVPPDTAVTMDFRPDRVRVSYDRSMVVTTIRCG